LNDDLLNDFLLESFPNPERKGCPDDEMLKAYAEDRLPSGNPVLPHISSCSECYREYRHYRQDWKDANSSDALQGKLAQQSEPTPIPSFASLMAPSRSLRGWAIAAGVIILLGSGYFLAREHRSAPSSRTLVVSSNTPVTMSVDLFNAVTTRGGDDDPTPLEQVSLPSSRVNLSVTLPRFSQSGPYQVLVSRDRAGQDVVARGVGQATEADKKVKLTVSLDLQHAASGAYFLATVRGSDNGRYYYPLKIR
jgi:hypothetical protein